MPHTNQLFPPPSATSDDQERSIHGLALTKCDLWRPNNDLKQSKHEVIMV